MYFYSTLWIRQCSCKYFGDPSGERERMRNQKMSFSCFSLILKCLLNKKIYTMCSLRQKTYTSTFSFERTKIHRVLKYLFEDTHKILENCARLVCWMQVRISQLFLSEDTGDTLWQTVFKCFKHSIPGYHIVLELLLPQLLGWGILMGKNVETEALFEHERETCFKTAWKSQCFIGL